MVLLHQTFKVVPLHHPFMCIAKRALAEANAKAGAVAAKLKEM